MTGGCNGLAKESRNHAGSTSKAVKAEGEHLRWAADVDERFLRGDLQVGLRKTWREHYWIHRKDVAEVPRERLLEPVMTRPFSG